MKVLTDTGSCKATLPELIYMLTELQNEYGPNVEIKSKQSKERINHWIRYNLEQRLDCSYVNEPIKLELWVD